MITRGNQTQKSIRDDLKMAKAKVKQSKIRTTAGIDPGKGEPVLVIEGKQIFHQDCLREISKLDPKDVVGIHIIDKPVSKEIYGANAVNGLIVVTKNNK